MMRRFRQKFAACLLLVLFPLQSVWGQSRIYDLVSEDLSVRFDAGWPGGGKGGYYPLRFRIVNAGESRQITLRVKPDGKHRVPTVKRTVQTDQNATVPVTLSIPLVGNGARAILEVLDENGDPIEGMKRDINLPAADMGEQLMPTILVISEAAVPMPGLEQIATLLELKQQQNSRYYRSGSRPGALDSAHVPPVFLPESWVDYTSIDLIFVDLVTLGSLRTSQRDALKKWTQCGGTLVVFNIGEAPEKSEEFNRLLDWKSQAATSAEWAIATETARGNSANLNLEMSPAQVLNNGFGSRQPGRGRGNEVQQTLTKPPRKEYRWIRNGAVPFYQRSLMWGEVVAFKGNPFNGTPFDWAWLLESLGKSRSLWEHRYGFSARDESKKEFLKFLIPGVTGVPTYSFLFLITAFTILIGPVNYFFLWKRKRLFFLVLTIPVIAFATSLALFGYSIVSHGFTVKARVRSLTILDQRSHDSVTISRNAVFAGMPPSGGLRFSADTAVFPLWATDEGFENGVVDWTDGQQMTSGWLRPRTRTQFLTVNHRRERGRLEIGKPQDGKIKVTNGFTWKIEALLLADEKGSLYYTAAIPAGQSALLNPITSENRRELDELLQRYPLELPDGVTENSIQNSGFQIGPRRRYYMPPSSAAYSGNLMERTVTAIRKVRTGVSVLSPNSYFAVLGENPDVDLGVEAAKEYNSYHLLLGYY